MKQKSKMRKSDEEWKKKLTSEQYQVLRRKGTERAFTGKYYAHKEKGMYKCAGCGAQLFDSNTKFDSGTGWPSFDKALPKAVKLKEDNSLFMNRIEVVCAKCGGHLGHIFNDGPIQTTGKRFCINSCALDFKDKKEKNKNPNRPRGSGYSYSLQLGKTRQSLGVLNQVEANKMKGGKK